RAAGGDGARRAPGGAGDARHAAYRRRATRRPALRSRVARVRRATADRYDRRRLHANRRRPGPGAMSGIAGAVHLDGRPADPALIGRMARALAHRGPDGESRWVAGPVGLAHRRLAAATPEDKQPFADTDGRVFVWDGRLDQPARFEHARGEFAVAAWDARSKTLLCARDAFGVKPLYYHWDGRRLLFASEVGALLEDAAVVRRPDASTIADHLLMDFRDPGATFFEGIRRVPPGHVLTVGKRGLSLHRYWRPAASAHVHERLHPRDSDRLSGATERRGLPGTVGAVRRGRRPRVPRAAHRHRRRRAVERRGAGRDR